MIAIMDGLGYEERLLFLNLWSQTRSDGGV